MADLRIVDAPVLLQESITDDVKMPTGGLGNHSIRLGDLVWYVVAKEQLASKSYVDTSSKGVQDKLDSHIDNKNNPHEVTKEQVGLGNVDNTADIDKPVSNATKSAIITATNDMATKAYVNQKDNLKADKATTLSGYGITDAYTKNETRSKKEIDDAIFLKADTSYVDSKDGDLATLTTTDKTSLVKAINELYSNTEGVVELYNRNTGLGVGGWSDTLISVSENINQRQVNDGLNSIADLSAVATPRLGQRFYVKSYHNSLNTGGGVFTLIDTAQVVDNGIVFASQDAGKKWVRAEQTYLTPDMFGAKPNDPSFDNTDALNRAFATGRTIYGKKDDVYYVDGILNTKGQQLLGGWKISTSRYNLGVVSTEVEPIDENRIRTLYVVASYDLAELLYIKNMGFNTINFYGGFSYSINDKQGTVAQMLDNAKAAKLRVNLNTEQGESASDYIAFIKKYDNHPSVWAYTAYDEPATRGISVSQQDAKIAAMKAVTKKPITMVDLILDNSPFTQVFSTNYDIAFVDSYAHKRTGDINTRVNADLAKMRLNYALVGEMTKAPKVIPVIGTFLFKGADYTDDIEQVLKSSAIFATVDGGNYGAFGWDVVQGDANITDEVRTNSRLRDFVREINKQRDIKKPVTDILLFGGRSTETDWGVSHLFKYFVQKDTGTDASEPINGGTYPITLKKSTAETSRGTPYMVNNVDSVSGIGFLGSWAAIVLNKKVRNHMQICLKFENANPMGATNFYLYETTDNGYTTKKIYEDTVTTPQSINVFEANIQTLDPNAGIAILITEPAQTQKINYRKVLFGYVLNTDW